MAVHGGGYLPSYSGRIDHAWGARRDSHADLPLPPTTYLRQVYLDTVVFTYHQLAYLIDLFGPDRIVMGTDYPFDMADTTRSVTSQAWRGWTRSRSHRSRAAMPPVSSALISEASGPLNAPRSPPCIPAARTDATWRRPAAQNSVWSGRPRGETRVSSSLRKCAPTI